MKKFCLWILRPLKLNSKGDNVTSHDKFINEEPAQEENKKSQNIVRRKSNLPQVTFLKFTI